jgi:antitoxin (DNA-binding transcriptional repressor) of toxin-antitoxin stability system
MPHGARAEDRLTLRHILCHIIYMPSVNIRQLRDTRRLKAWLHAGETVELRERNRVIARIVPANGDKPPAEWPDFAARSRKILGDRVLPNMVLEERKRSRY